MQIIRCSISIALLLLLSLLPATPAKGDSSPLVLADGLRYSLAGQMEMLIDREGKLGFEEILAPLNQARFAPIPGFVNRGYTNDTVWVRFSLFRTPLFPHDPTLRIWPPYLDYVYVYVQTADDPTEKASYHLMRTGDHIPVAERPVADVDLSVPLEIPEKKPRFVYLKLRTTSSVNLFAEIHTEPDYIRQGSISSAREGGYLAVCLVVALINLVLFIRLYDRLYLFFSLYVLSLFISVAATSGLITLFLPAVAHRLSDYMIAYGVSFSFFFITLFVLRLFGGFAGKWLHYFSIAACFVSFLTAASVHFNAYNRMAPILFAFTLILIFVITLVSLNAYRMKEPSGSLYLAAFGAFNIGYFIQLLRVLGAIPVAWWNLNSVEISSLFNMVLMTMAMTERVRRAEANAIQAALEAEQKAVRLAEEMTEDLREKQQELENALERKARFVEMVSHEYRTPLAIIQANLDILDLHANTDRQIPAKSLKKMQRSVNRLVEVIESSLQRARLQSIELNHKMELADAAEFLSHVLTDAKEFWPNATIVAAPGISIASRVTIEKSLIKTALFNLIDNAIKYSGKGATVTLSLATVEDEVRFSVADLGPGIPDSERNMVLEKFYRGSHSTGKPGGGLGLFLVRKIVEEHDGRLELSANTPQGTIATLVLPKAQ